MGTALAGSIMIAAVSSAFVVNIVASPAIPAEAKSQAQTELAGGVPFVSDADLEAALDETEASSSETDAALEAYGDARIEGLQAALALLAVLVVIALFAAQFIPRRPVGAPEM
jgi:uncharacterized membrane protein